jgi:Caspase domain
MSIIAGTRRAVVVGINRYKRAVEDNIQVLTGAENDAQEMYERLKRTETCNFEISANHLLKGESATYERIRIAISDLLWKTGICDIALFYFSGHAIVDSYGVGYLAPYDMFKNDPTVFGLKIQDLKDLVKNSVDRKAVILILDCCYSGLATKGDPRTDFDRNLDGAEGEGRIIIASTEADAVSREIPDYTHSNREKPHAHGIFTSHLIDGLDGDAADRGGKISINGLLTYLDNKMTGVKKQRPRHSVSEGSKTDQIMIGFVPGTYYRFIENELIGAKNIIEQNHLHSQVFQIRFPSTNMLLSVGIINL